MTEKKSLRVAGEERLCTHPLSFPFLPLLSLVPLVLLLMFSVSSHLSINSSDLSSLFPLSHISTARFRPHMLTACCPSY